jgi:hypothetical protein
MFVLCFRSSAQQSINIHAPRAVYRRPMLINVHINFVLWRFELCIYVYPILYDKAVWIGQQAAANDFINTAIAFSRTSGSSPLKIRHGCGTLKRKQLCYFYLNIEDRWTNNVSDRFFLNQRLVHYKIQLYAG